MRDETFERPETSCVRFVRSMRSKMELLMRLPENPMPRRMTVLDDIPPGVRASMAEDYVRREMSLKRIAKERGMPVCRVRAVMLSEGVKLRSAKETAPLRYKQALLEQRLRGE